MTAGLVSMLRRQAGPNALSRIYYREAVLGCTGHRKTREEGLGLTLVTGVAHCLSGTHRMGALVGSKGENWHWLRGCVCSESKGRKYAGVLVLYTNTLWRPDLHEVLRPSGRSTGWRLVISDAFSFGPWAAVSSV